MNNRFTAPDLFSAAPEDIPNLPMPRWQQQPNSLPWNMGKMLIRRCMPLGTVQALGINAVNAVGIIGFETENGFFAFRLTSQFVALLAAEFPNIREKTSD